MRKILIAMVAVAALAALPAMALAGVVNSVHDLPDFYNYTGTAALKGTCSFCHLPHKAQGGDKLFPTVYTSGLPDTWSSDSLSNMCWFCHGSSSGYTSAREVMPFQSTSHRRSVTTLQSGINGGAGEDDSSWSTAPADLNLTGTQLRCVSCHSIHDNAKRPFLAWGVSGDFSGGVTSTPGDLGFCGKCHDRRDNASTFGLTNPGMHPSRTTYTDVGTNSPLVGGNGVIPTVFQIDMGTLGNALAGGWNLGGHANYSGGTESTTFACGTCHTVHANESTDFASATDGNVDPGPTTPVVAPGADLTPLRQVQAGGTDMIEDMCEGCHSIVIGSGGRGPGAASTFSHPVGTDSAWGAAMFSATEGYLWNTAATLGGGIMCQSCHDMHFSNLNHGSTATGSYLQAFQCGECHAVAGAQFAAGVHHISNVAGANTLAAGTTMATGIDWSTRAVTSTAFNYWAKSTTMDCMTCHGQGNAKAHNNAGAFPGLTGNNAGESEMCVDCHTMNPSAYSGHSTTGTATHYVGAINTDGTGYKVTTTLVGGYGNNAPIYSTDGTNGSVICDSCHTIKINGKNSHVVSYQFSNNVSDTLASTKDSVQNVLLVSGNSDDLAAAADNLCTACHGATPGGGQSHPTLPNYTGASTMTPTGEATTIAGHSAGRINCESCHRPHDADSDSNNADWSNAWILEAAGTGTGYIDYSPLCDNCHPAQY